MIFLFKKKILLSIVFFVFLSFLFSFTYALDFEFNSIIKDFINILLYKPTMAILRMSAYIFDNFLIISLNPAFLNQDFIKVSWANMRDLANIAFIIGSLYVAYGVMMEPLGKGGQWKKTFIYLIMVVFIVNFSFVFSRMVIDAGNLFGRVIFSTVSMELVGDEAKHHFLIAEQFIKKEYINDTDKRTVAGAFAAKMDPKVMLGSEMFVALEGKGVEIGQYFVIMMTFAIVNITLASILFSGGFMMLTRLIWLMLYIIISPLAFVLLFLPESITLGKSFWKDWMLPLLNRSFCISIFLFFIWLGMLVLTSTIQTNTTAADFSESGQAYAAILAMFVVKAAAVLLLLNLAKSKGAEFCEGEAAGKLQSGVTGLLKGVGGKLTGGLTRRVVGRFGGNIKNGKGVIGGLASRMTKSNNRLTSSLGMHLHSLGDKIEKTKIGGKTFAEAEKERRGKAEKLLANLPKEIQKSVRDNEKKRVADRELKFILGKEQKMSSKFVKDGHVSGVKDKKHEVVWNDIEKSVKDFKIEKKKTFDVLTKKGLSETEINIAMKENGLNISEQQAKKDAIQNAIKSGKITESDFSLNKNAKKKIEKERKKAVSGGFGGLMEKALFATHSSIADTERIKGNVMKELEKQEDETEKDMVGAVKKSNKKIMDLYSDTEHLIEAAQWGVAGDDPGTLKTLKTLGIGDKDTIKRLKTMNNNKVKEFINKAAELKENEYRSKADAEKQKMESKLNKIAEDRESAENKAREGYDLDKYDAERL